MLGRRVLSHYFVHLFASSFSRKPRTNVKLCKYFYASTFLWLFGWKILLCVYFVYSPENKHMAALNCCAFSWPVGAAAAYQELSYICSKAEGLFYATLASLLWGTIFFYIIVMSPYPQKFHSRTPKWLSETMDIDECLPSLSRAEGSFIPFASGRSHEPSSCRCSSTTSARLRLSFKL